MTESILFDRLRPGRDPNDTSWVQQRFARDWRAGQSHGLVFNARTRALELAPVARPELAADWLPLAAVRAPDGTLYRADPEHDTILARGACDADFVPLEGFGGTGHATGWFHTPTGLSVDGAGRLYVADSGNGRVQVLDPAAGEVIAVLQEGLVRPVQAAVGDNGETYVADAGTGRVHAFGPTFLPCSVLRLATRDPWTEELWPDIPAPRPLAIVIEADRSLAVFDPLRAALWHMHCDGTPLTALPWPAAGQEPPGWAATPARFAAEGEMIVGPLDGGVHDLAWHRVLLKAEAPDRTEVSVQTFAANAPDADVLSWAPRLPVAMPKAQADRPGAEFDRLVLANGDLWTLSRLGRLTRARPEIHRFDGDGPVAADRFALPADVARRVRAGDRIVLTTDAGGSADYLVAGAADRRVLVAASGPETALAASAHLRLIARDDGLPFGPVDLGHLVAPANVAVVGLARTGHPEEVFLPHGLVAELLPGDVVEFAQDGDVARIEILEVSDDPVDITLERAVEGDFSASTVTLAATSGRLCVLEQLPDTGLLAPGSAATVIDDVRSERHGILYTDATNRTVWLDAPLAHDITQASWTDVEVAEPRASDRGRYLWVRLVLRGAPLPPPDRVGPPVLASATPSIRSLRVTGPRPSLLTYLPAIFSERDLRLDAPGALFLERFLALFEGQFTRIESAYESVSRLLNPEAADAAWLEFVAAWLALAFDESWPVERRRMLVAEGATLQAAAGTPRALARYLEIYTGAPVAITEDFRNRPPPPMQLGARGALGVAPLGGDARADGFAHSFAVRVTLPPDRERAASLSAIHQIVETMKPAQTRYRLDTGGGRRGRIGVDTTVDGIVIPGPHPVDPCLCDPEAPPGYRVQTGQVSGGFRLGGRLGHGPESQIASQGDHP